MEPENEMDKYDRIQAELGCPARFAVWMATGSNRERLCQLITSYADDDAKEKLAILREEFWSTP